MTEASNKTIELGKGIFQFGPVSQPQENGNLRVFVHPYVSYYRDNLNYVRTRDRLILEEDIPIIMLIDENELKSTVRKYRNPLFKNYRMIAVTKVSDPEPKTRTWKELKDFIRSEFNPRELFISGGELRVKIEGKNKRYSGCVGTAFLHLKELNPQIQVETCYVTEY